MLTIAKNIMLITLLPNITTRPIQLQMPTVQVTGQREVESRDYMGQSF